MKPSVLLPADTSGLLHLADECTYSDAGIVSRTVLNADRTRVVLFAFAPGQELTEHTSTSRALVIALEGSADFTVEGITHEMKAGDFLHMPPNAPHAVLAREKFAMLLVLHKPEAS